MRALWSIEKLREVQGHEYDQSVMTHCALQQSIKALSLFILKKAWVNLSIVCNQLQKHWHLGVEVGAISDENSEAYLERRCKFLIQRMGDVA